MPVGDSHLAFAEAASRDGIELTPDPTLDWLTELGHLTLEDIAAEPPPSANPGALNAAAAALESIYIDLGGDIDVLLSCRANLFLPVDLVHEATGTVIEIDESQHFTSFRLRAIDAYPADAKVGFDLDTYRELCRTWADQMDTFARSQAGKGFGIGGIQRQRAYRDSLRDLGAVPVGHPPVLRIICLDDDGAAAYQRNQELLLDVLGAAR